MLSVYKNRKMILACNANFQSQNLRLLKKAVNIEQFGYNISIEKSIVYEKVN